MEYIVRIGIGKGDSKLEWGPVEVDAVDRWDALVKAAEGLGIEERFTMSYLWQWASIVKKDRCAIRRWRVKT